MWNADRQEQYDAGYLAGERDAAQGRARYHRAASDNADYIAGYDYGYGNNSLQSALRERSRRAASK